ncbi:PREDICTED: lipocalin-like [Poecilia mexicana]|uniref:lipocalin-like n=1 Tax=Poecilia mexicana TaxID=48701 RepID=UPI00072E05C6|nr:PREDICTED: lipocalin-like [Poecilia mexicana]
MTPLLVLLGAALCSLTMSTEIVPQPGFDLKEAEGKWYLIGFATNSRWYINNRDKIKMGIATLTSTAEGHMRVSYASLNKDGSCSRKKYRANKTDIPGKFVFVSRRGGSEKHTIMVEIKYDNFALIYDMKKKKKGAITKIVRLYSRTDEASDEVKEKFRQLAYRVGTLTENIFFLPKNAPCPPA